MANSKLLKEAIADAKAVKETALANAKLALEEAFTPRLQSILSQKLQAEAEVDKDDDMQNEELDSSNIGSKTDAGYAETPGAQPSLDADTDLSVGVKKDSGKPEQAGTDYKKVADISEDENPFAQDDAMAGDDEKQNEIAQLRARLAELEAGEDSEDDTMAAGDEMGSDEMGSDDLGGDDQFGGDDQESEDDLDLEAIIRELEAQLEGEDAQEEPVADENPMAEIYHDGEEAGTDKSEDPAVKVANEQEDVTKATVKGKVGSFDNVSEDVIDLEEILREMEDDMKDGEEEKKDEAVQAELNEAYATIKSLQRTINEVNLLNAKLLFANKLFRAHNMTNEQKVKVIETLDRTKSVREVKLVYSTLAENFKYTSSTSKANKKSITEGIASKAVKSTKPAAAKVVIAESADFSDRFKKLAGIIK
jgi:hypothetical protein